MRGFIIFILVGCAYFPLTLHAATFTVNTTTDSVDTVLGDGNCATSSDNCSLRAAVQEANALAGNDTINLPSGTIMLSITGAEENDAATGDIDITSTIIINGHTTNGTVIDGDSIDRIIEVRSGANLTLDKVTLQNGKIDLLGSDALGGAILNSATLSVTNSAFINNISSSSDSNARGGAIANDFGGTLTLTNASFSGNTILSSSSVTSFGGALFNNATATLTHTTFSGNIAGFGGAINSGIFSTTTIKNSIFTANTATGGLGGNNCYGGTFTSSGYNIETTNNTCNFVSTGDQNSISTSSLNLGTLADNGGPSKTFALGSGSVAIDLIPTTSCTTTAVDQRGMARPQGSTCDVGAYERDQTAPTITLAGSNPQTVSCATSTYSDPGATATDNFDTSVTVSSNATTAVTATTPGNYTVTYSAQDQLSNGSSATRTVVINGATYYQDSDGDGLGNLSSTITNCSATTPTGYVTNNGDANDQDKDNDGTVTTSDCNDNDDTVSTNQTYYEDADGDGLGNAAVTTTACTMTAPNGYTSDTADTNDTIKNNGIEISGDGIDNDGDDAVDEKNTLTENGVHPEYGTYDPTDTALFTGAITKIQGAKNGKIVVTYADNSVYSYVIFNVDSDNKTKVKSYKDTAYLVLVDPQAKKIALVQAYLGEIMATKKLTDKTYKAIGLKIAQVRDHYVCVVTAKKEEKVLLSLVNVQLANTSFGEKSQMKYKHKKVEVSKTEVKSKKINLRNNDNKILKTYKVTGDYTLVE